MNLLSYLSSSNKVNRQEKEIAEKVLNKVRISDEDALYLYTKPELPFVGMLANHIRSERHGKKTYFLAFIKDKIVIDNDGKAIGYSI